MKAKCPALFPPIVFEDAQPEEKLTSSHRDPNPIFLSQLIIHFQVAMPQTTTQIRKGDR